MNAQHASGAPRLLSPLRATALVMAVAVAAPQAQVMQGTAARNSESPAPAAAGGAEADVNEIQLLVGRSTVLNTGQAITRVSLTSPNVADAMVTSTEQLLIHGKTPGTISMFVWNRAGGIKRYEVVVQRDLSQLVAQMKQLFPGEPIGVVSNGKDVVISGTVSTKYVVEKAAEVAAGYVEKKEDVVNLLKQQEGVATQQVLLRVRFAEVSRSAMTELGASLFMDGRDNRFARTTTQQFAAPFFSEPDAILGRSLVFSDYLNLFLFDAKNQIGGVIRALQNKGLFQSLAEPNLVAENGKEASFLAGGEYPYPVVQGQSGGTSVTIQFKEFGIKLNFTPTIVGQDLVKLKVRPEVSSLDFSNALILEGFRIPSLQTRRTETEIELQDGQTFAIAGLLNNTVASQLRKVPGIGDIPILGLLFRSKAAEKNQTELVVMITPQILRRNSTGVSPTLPSIVEPFMGAPKKVVPAPDPWSPGMQPQSQHAQPAPSQPVAAPASAPVRAEAPAAQPPAETAAAAPVATPAPADTPATLAAAPEAQGRTIDLTPRPRAKLTKEQKAAIKRAEKEAAEEAKRQRQREAEEAKLRAKQEEADRKAAKEAAKEQARLDAELRARQTEASKKQAEADKKRAEELARAQQKLKAAQREYEAALQEPKQ